MSAAASDFFFGGGSLNQFQPVFDADPFPAKTKKLSGLGKLAVCGTAGFLGASRLVPDIQTKLFLLDAHAFVWEQEFWSLDPKAVAACSSASWPETQV